MSKLKFVVIPSKNEYEEYSENIVSRIEEVNNCSAEVDKNYKENLKVRINKYKKNNKNIITIGLSEIEHDTIMIHFNGSRPKTMECDEFITLLESYDDDEDDGSQDDTSVSSESSDEDVGNMFQTQKQKQSLKKNVTINDQQNNDDDGDKDVDVSDEDTCIIC